MNDSNCDDGNRPAFPFACQGPTTGPETYYGLTKREYFAGLAMQGFCRDSHAAYMGGPCNDAIVKRSVIVADALLAELSKGTPDEEAK